MALVPMVIEREGNGERAMDLGSRMLKDRNIWVVGPIEPGMANIIKQELYYLEYEDPEADITMYIDSPGGECSTGLGIYDAMQNISCDVRTMCVGQAASMASVLLMGGTKGKRFANPNAEIMIHQPSSGTQGKITDMQIALKHGIELKERMQKIYVKHTGQPEEKIKADWDRDFYMWAEDAIKYGIIDKIDTKHEIARPKEDVE